MSKRFVFWFCILLWVLLALLRPLAHDYPLYGHVHANSDILLVVALVVVGWDHFGRAVD